MRFLPLLLIAAMLMTPIPASGQDADSHCDFNGDGYDDSAIGVPSESVGLVSDAGAVHVLLGSPNRLTADGDQVWTQKSRGIKSKQQNNDLFGRAVACGDFNDDGYDDLVASSPGESLKLVVGAGALHVIYGSKDGLTADGSQFLHRNTPGVKGEADSHDFLGFSLAVGDFDGDGNDDLAAGAYWDDVVKNAVEYQAAGSVQVFYGSDTGLSVVGDQIWHRGKKGIKGVLVDEANFGSALAAGDFDGDGRDDLAIGSWADGKQRGRAESGSVSVVYGSSSGLSAKGSDLLHRDADGVRGTAESYDRFGYSLAAGDFDGDGFDELAVGVPRDDVSDVENAGSVHLFVGGPKGVKTAGDVIWHRDVPGVKDHADRTDQFGWSLTVGEFDKGKRADLAIGVPGDDFGKRFSVGSVHLLRGGIDGLKSGGDEIWHQDLPGVKGGNQRDDGFGNTLGSGDFDGNGRSDLVVGIPLEDFVLEDVGRIAVIYGSDEGLTASGDQSWSQDSPGVKGVGDSDDQFGFAVG